MKKINRIKLLFAALPVIVIALLLFMRWNEYGRSYKSRAQWGTGKMGVSENTYYSNRINSIVAKWQQESDKENVLKDPNTSFLHIDLEKNALWLEENGQVQKENYTNLPENISWQLSSSVKYNFNDLPEHIILRWKGPNKNSIALLFLKGQSNHFITMISFLWDGNYEGPPLDINSHIVSEEEYRKYKDSLKQNTAKQSIEKETPEQVALQENKSRWLDIEKKLYMEIDGQIQHAGYKINSLEIGKSPNYTDAYAVIQGSGESVLYKFVDWVSDRKIIQAYFKIYYLGDDIWYARTASHPNHKLKSDRKLNLDFLIYPQEQITRSQYMKYIKLGRKVQQIEK